MTNPEEMPEEIDYDYAPEQVPDEAYASEEGQHDEPEPVVPDPEPEIEGLDDDVEPDTSYIENAPISELMPVDEAWAPPPEPEPVINALINSEISPLLGHVAPQTDPEPPIIIEDSAASIENAFSQLGITLTFNKRTKGVDWDGCYDDSVAKRRLEEHGLVHAPTAKDPDRMKPWRLGMARWHDLLKQVYSVTAYDPWHQWLEDLPDWDGVERYPMLACFSAPDTPYNRFVSMLPFIGAAGRRDAGEYFKYDFMVVLIGPQGIAKSSFLAFALPDEMQTYFVDSVDFDDGIDKAAERAKTAVIAEVAEMHNMYKAEVSNVKRFITSRNYKARMPYDRVPIDCVPSWVLVGTANNPQCIPFDAEARRFWPITVESRLDDVIENYDFTKDWWDDNREQVWAEAIVKASNREWLRNIVSLAPEQAERASDAMAISDDQQQIADWIEDWKPTPEKDYLTIREIIEAIWGTVDNKSEERRLRRYATNALQAADFTKGRRFRRDGMMVYPWLRAESAVCADSPLKMFRNKEYLDRENLNKRVQDSAHSGITARRDPDEKEPF